MRILERTIRITIAATLAIIIAMALNLNNPLSAGIVALLSVLETRRETLRVAGARMISVFVAFAIATCCFWWLGFTVWAFALYLLCFVPISYYYNLVPGLSPSSVLVTHFIIAESIAWSWQVNGVLLMGIGALSALVTSVWMPDQQVKIRSLRLSLEQQMCQLLYLLSQYMLDPSQVDLQSIHQRVRVGEKYLTELKQVSHRDYDNQLIAAHTYDLDYVNMRQQQYDQLKQMVQIVQSLDSLTPQHILLSELFKRAADEFDESNTGIELLELLSEIYLKYRQSSLPTTRLEFENRALLYQLLITFETFLELKRDFYINTQTTHQKTSA